ncbi:REXO1 [Branchiostoma lanceolatum]|uniref:REXO1 protein n=1 Tax=Branchiostoma lanceolatum TaxID=7740 RepID=A0A8J9YW39_BRALA|nr:REXO1 [Branchiostoma lanceolatum]
MFTSSGFFRDSPCPFMSEGVCDRAHCHFKHEGPAQTASTNSLSGNHVAQEDSPGRSSTVLRIDIVKDAVDKVRNVLEKEQRDLGHHHGNYIPYDPSVSESSQRGAVPVPAVHAKLPSTMPGIVEYRPTPIAELKKRQAAGIDVTVQEHPSTEYDPTCPSTDSGRSLGYRPTPISDLDISDARQDPPMNKYSEAFKYQGTDMEYDPIMNYSAIPKQQKRKLPDQSSEDMGSAAQPVRKLSQNHHASDSTQGNSELREETIADNVSNNKERDLTVSESDAVSETDLGLSTTENKMMTSLKDTVKDAKQLFKSKTSTNKTKVSEQLNKLGSDSNISSGPDDIKRRKTSKHVKDAKIPRDQSGTSDKKAVKHVKTKPKNKQKDVKSEVDGNKNSSTRKNSAKEEKTTKEGQQVKRVRTENSSTPRSISKLKNTDKNSFKSSRCLPKVKEEGNCNVDLVFEDYPSSDVSDWEKKTKLKKARHEEIKRQMPEDVVYVSSTSDECNTVYGNLVEEEKKRIQYLKHSVSLTKGVTSKLSERYDPKVLEKVDWIKTKKQMLNPSDSDEDFSKLNSMTVKTTYKHHRRSDFEEGKVNTSQKKCGKDSRNIKPTSESSSHEHVKEKGGKVRTKSSSSSSNSVSKKEASNDKHRKIMACKSSRSQKKLIPKSKSPYDLTFADSDSDTRAREKSRQSKSALKKVKSCEDKDGKSKMTPGIKVSHADLFGEESEDDVSMATGDGTSQDASSDNPTSGPDLDPEVLRRLEQEEFEDSEDPYEECLRIFQETHGKMADNKMGTQDDPQESLDLSEEQVHCTSLPGQAGKKRTAHLASFDTSNMKRMTQKRPRPSASQQIHDRYKRLQEMAVAVPPAEPESTPCLTGSSLSSAAHKKRLAHRPKIPPPTGKYTLNNKRSAATPQNSLRKSTTPPAPTLAKTAPKGGRRVAHTPALTTLKRPTVPAEFGSKIPTSTRQQYLNKIVDECLLICQSEQAAYDRALKEERDCYDRCTARQGYLTATVSTIRRLRSEHGLTTTPTKAVSSHQRPKMSHAAVLGGSKAAHTSFSIHRHTSQSSGDSLQGAELYRYLLQYVLTEDQLKENGFPRPSLNKPGSAVLFKEQTKKSSHPTMKCCARCGKQFTVLNNNRYLKRDECVYHHGKLWKRKVAGGLESRYTCCQGDAQTDGCCTGELHVWDSRKEDMDGYVTTLQKSPSEDPGVFALDCEMCYTYGGMELTRVSVVNWSMKLVYETLVKPENIVIDYNTRFSGIKEEDMAGIETTIRDVQAVLLSMFSADTILLGHSLESDLLSLKIIHSKVVDTSVVFPHKMGPPFKRALRTLMNEFLQKIIQNDVGGHDSKEDAVACVDLMKWRIKEDIRSSKL